VDLESYERVSANRSLGNIVYIGRFTAHKRVDMLIDAVKYLRQTNQSVRLDLLGSGPRRADLEILAESLGSTVSFHGLVSEESKIRFLKESGVLVLPSEREGYGSVVVEAMAAGTPVVTTDFAGNAARLLVSRYGCGLVTPHSKQGLASGIALLLDDRSLWRRCSEACLEGARSLDWRSIAGELSRYLTRVCSEW
jgi:glycosyltransferase involved in cell wall biosynthesis